jgi:hypothetical protein
VIPPNRWKKILLYAATKVRRTIPEVLKFSFILKVCLLICTKYLPSDSESVGA